VFVRAKEGRLALLVTAVAFSCGDEPAVVVGREPFAVPLPHQVRSGHLIASALTSAKNTERMG
jgi:hypothetical protein